jgi:hypothetical protein
MTTGDSYSASTGVQWSRTWQLGDSFLLLGKRSVYGGA